VCTALWQLVGTILYLFWTTSWFDVVAHILGGATVAFFTLWGIGRSTHPFSYINILSFTLISVFMVGIVWEAFELTFHITDIHTLDYVSDTGLDLMDDLLGGMIAFCVVNYRKLS
jgi:hypothetical protein